MAFYLEKNQTGSTPYVLIDEEKGYMKIAGESFHENIIEFFKEINAWLNDYLISDFESLTLDFEMLYFNSSTAKLLLNMLINMDDHAQDGKKITVNWITTSNNPIIIECGEDFADEMTSLTFNLVIDQQGQG
jgi:hypothetical protein